MCEIRLLYAFNAFGKLSTYHIGCLQPSKSLLAEKKRK